MQTFSEKITEIQELRCPGAGGKLKFMNRLAITGFRSIAMVAGLLLIPVLGAVIGARPALAQNRNAGEIRGTVTDASGAVLSGVQITARELSTGLKIGVTSSEAGFYDMPYVTGGHYDITFTKDGFKTYVAHAVELHVDTITVNAKLEVGAVSMSVTVNALPDLLQTESADSTTVLQSEEITQLPDVGANWMNFIELLPGISLSPGTYGQNNQGVSIAGAQSYQSQWLLDGGVATLAASYNPDAIQPPLEAISEVDMTALGFGAENSVGLSSFNVITKAGTNKFHGSGWEYNQNNYVNAPPKVWGTGVNTAPPIHWNQFGGTIGGPIARDKMFFFGSYQRLVNHNGSYNVSTEPTSDMRAGNFSNSFFPKIIDPMTGEPFPGNIIPTDRLDPTAQIVLSYLPKPNTTGITTSSPYVHNYQWVGLGTGAPNWYNWRVDGDLFKNHHIYTSGEVFHQVAYFPTADILSAGLQDVNEIASQLTDAWTVTQHQTNELRLSFAREADTVSAPGYGQGYRTKFNMPNLPFDAPPTFNISGGPFSIGFGNSSVNLLREDNVSIADTYTWIAGKHTIKVGAEYDNWTDDGEWNQESVGNFNFTGFATQLGFADFLLGAIHDWNVAYAPLSGGRDHNLQFFAQDAFKVRPNLTITYGLRAIDQSGWSEVHNRFSMFNSSLANPADGTPGALGFAGVNIPKQVENSLFFASPRVGFAWTPIARTSVRGGFGLYTVPFGATTYAQGLGVGWGVRSEETATGLTPPFYLKAGPPAVSPSTPATRIGSLLNGQTVSYVPYSSPMEFAEQWQLNVQQQYGNYLISVAYVGNDTKNLPFITDINQPTSAANLASGTRPFHNFNQINGTRFIGWANYNSLQATFKRQMSHGLSFVANYTWAKALDTGTDSPGWGITMSGPYSWSAVYGEVWQDAYNVKANYGASSNDVRRLLNGSILYQLPFGKGKTFLNHGKLVDAVLGGWQAGTAYQYRSGQPFTPYITNTNDINNGSGAYPVFGEQLPNVMGSTKVPNRSVKGWFNTNAFQTPAPNAFGNSGRDYLYGPNYADIDGSMSKSFGFEAANRPMSFEVKMDVFDMFNHPNYSVPDFGVNDGPGVFGVISGSLTNRQVQFVGILHF